MATTVHLSSDHAVNIPVGTGVTLTIIGGDTVYYADTPAVSAAANQGTLTTGSVTIFDSPLYAISKTQTDVSVSGVAPLASFPRGVVVTPEMFGATGNAQSFTTGLIAAGSNQFTCPLITAGLNGRKIYIRGAGASVLVTTTTAQTGTGSITSLTVSSSWALGTNMNAGVIRIVDPTNTHTKDFVNAQTNTGLTSITVLGDTPGFNFPIGSSIYFQPAGLSATITSSVPGVATLSASALTTVQGNCQGVFGTDDTVAFNAAVNAIRNAAGGTLLLNAAGYLLDGTPITTFNGNAVVPLPYGGGVYEIVGAATTSAAIQLGSLPRTTLYTTRQTDVYNGGFGQPSLLGCATPQNGGLMGFGPNIFRISNLTIVTPENYDQVHGLGALDLGLCQGIRLRDVQINTWGFLSGLPYWGVGGNAGVNGTSFGVMCPRYGNGGGVVLDDVQTGGTFGCNIVIAENARINGGGTFGCAYGLGCLDATGGNPGYPNTLNNIALDHTSILISGFTDGVGFQLIPAGHNFPVLVGTVQQEDASGQQFAPFTLGPLWDGNNQIIADLAFHQFALAGGYLGSFPGRSGGTKMSLRSIDPSQRRGTAVLSGGTVTVTPPASAQRSLAATSRVNLTTNTVGGTQGALFIAGITAGTSFIIKSTSGTDTSTVNWEIVN